MALTIIKKPKPPATGEESPQTAAGEKTVKSTVGSATLGATEPMCMVTVEMSYSHKLASEDWVKFGVTLAMPSKTGDINKTFDYIKAWEDEKLNAAVEELNATPE